MDGGGLLFGQNYKEKLVFENKVNSEKVKCSLQNFPRSDYLYQEHLESETTSGSLRADTDNSENAEPAGPSQLLPGRMAHSWCDVQKIVSDGEPAQLTQTRRLTFNLDKQLASKDYLKIPEKKTEYDITREFPDLECKSLPSGECKSGNELCNRRKNSHRGIIPYVQKIVSDGELAQLTQIRPLTFNLDKQLAFKDYLKILEKKKEYDITREFLDLECKSLPSGECKSGTDPCNRRKNRYQCIFPYDSTCVPLGKSKGYINASYIRIVNNGEEYFYIATQDPLPGTTDDFWQMVFENNSNVIAMVTKDKEDAIIKCHRYWPVSLNEPLELKQFRICLLNYQILPHFIIRMFQVVKKSTGTSHTVKHLQFTKWPDYGIPDSTDSFIKYVRYARKSHLTGPMVVHCSSGVGRSGVFICIDVVFCAIEKNYLFDIVNIVTQMREQRSGMIQTKKQYWFSYKIVLKVLQNLLATEWHGV